MTAKTDPTTPEIRIGARMRDSTRTPQVYVDPYDDDLEAEEAMRDFYKAMLRDRELAARLPEAQEYRRQVAADNRRRTGRLQAAPVAEVAPPPPACETIASLEPEPENQVAFLSTKALARHLRRRPASLYALIPQALADGVAVRVGGGAGRQHTRWHVSRATEWLSVPK